MGRDRKRHARIHGTTPAFPIHTPEVDAAAPAAQVPPPAQAADAAVGDGDAS